MLLLCCFPHAVSILIAVWWFLSCNVIDNGAGRMLFGTPTPCPTLWRRWRLLDACKSNACFHSAFYNHQRKFKRNFRLTACREEIQSEAKSHSKRWEVQYRSKNKEEVCETTCFRVGTGRGLKVRWRVKCGVWAARGSKPWLVFAIVVLVQMCCKAPQGSFPIAALVQTCCKGGRRSCQNWWKWSCWCRCVL